MTGTRRPSTPPPLPKARVRLRFSIKLCQMGLGDQVSGGVGPWVKAKQAFDWPSDVIDSQIGSNLTLTVLSTLLKCSDVISTSLLTLFPHG